MYPTRSNIIKIGTESDIKNGIKNRLRLITVIPNYYSQNKKNKSAVKVVLQTELLIQFAIVQQKDLHSHNAILIWSVALRFRSFFCPFLSWTRQRRKKEKKRKKETRFSQFKLHYSELAQRKLRGNQQNSWIERQRIGELSMK